MIQKITENNLPTTTKNFAVVFSAEWCDSCHKLIDHLNPLADVFKDRLYNADVDDNEDLAEKYKVKSLPCIIIFKDGKQDMRYENNYNFGELLSVISKL